MSTVAALIRSFLTLRAAMATGVMTVWTHEERARTFVYLRGGVPVFAEEGTQGETLGRMLVRQRVLTQAQYVEVVTKMTDALVLNEQLRFGEVAVELGYLTEAQVASALSDQVRWKIIRTFQRPDASWSFDASVSRVEEAGNFPMQIEALVLDAARWMDDEAKMDLALGRALDTRLVVDQSQLSDLALRFALTKDEATFVAALDGRRDVRVLLRAPDVDAHALLTALIVTRAVCRAVDAAADVSPDSSVLPSAPPRGDGRHPTRVDGPARPPPPVHEQPQVHEERSGAAAAARARAQTERRESVGDGSDRRQPRPLTRASKILQALDAQRIRADPARRPSSVHEARLIAERLFQGAVVQARLGRYAQALPGMRRASELMPESHEYRLYAKWVAIRARSNEPPHPVERAELRRLAHAAATADPNLAFAHFVAATVALDDGDAGAAYRLFVRAAKLDPDLLEAKQKIRMLARSR